MSGTYNPICIRCLGLALFWEQVFRGQAVHCCADCLALIVQEYAGRVGPPPANTTEKPRCRRCGWKPAIENLVEYGGFALHRLCLKTLVRSWILTTLRHGGVVEGVRRPPTAERTA